jgi:hypothetical protein
MINSGQIVLREAPWLTLFPGAAIVLTVLAFNLLGDAIRDALDPAVRDVTKPLSGGPGRLARTEQNAELGHRRRADLAHARF